MESASDHGLIVHRFEAMKSGMVVRIPNGPAALDAALRIEAEVRRIESKYSRYRSDSVLSRINSNAGNGIVALDEESAALFRFADQAFHLTQGLFDVTSGVLRRIWDFRSGKPPLSQEIATILPLIGWEKVTFNGDSISLPAGMEIDLGGIGKEYACDRAAGLCLAAGIENALINLGGDLWALGHHPSGRSWQVGIPHPRQDRLALQLEVAHCAVATSGDYERFFEFEGHRYHHILSPRTGMPGEGAASVTVCESSCLAAGVGATTAILMAPEEARTFLGSQRAVLISASGEISQSEGLDL